MNEREIGDIHVEISGHGDPVVLLHGNGESLRTMRRQADALRHSYRVISMDARGHGRSRRGTGPLSIARLADDVADVVAKLEPGHPAHVVGYSDGANVAMELAVRHPTLVRSLVLIAGNLDPEGLASSSLRTMRLVERVLRVAARFSKRARRRLEVWRLMTDDPHIDPAALADVDVPALVVVGDRDVIRPTHSRLIATSLPRGRIAVVRGAGHGLIHSKSQQVNDLIVRFLAAT